MKVHFSLNKQTSVYKKDIEKLYNIALEITQKPKNICANVVLVSPSEIKELNSLHRGVNNITDVLSFPMIDDFDNIEREPDYLLGNCNIGDIYINLERANEQAIEYGHSLKREFCFLALHGFLHLLGYDHIEKSDEEEMFGLQNKIMEIVGIGREN